MSLKKYYEEYVAKDILDFIHIIRSNKFIWDISIYRGHSNKDWKLLPRIARNFELLECYYSWESFATQILDDFKKYAIQYMNRGKVPTNIVEWTVTAQHYSLPTRLLDWTKNPLKALFFAIEDLSENYDSAIWVLTSEILNWDLLDFKGFDASSDSTYQVYFPDQINHRLIAQEGCFTFHKLPSKKITLIPVEESDKVKTKQDKLIKIIIPKDTKENYKIVLDKFGLNRHTLFPDLDGLAKYLCCKYEFK